MALQKPYNISLKGVTIDANEPNEVTWKVSGDIQTAYKIDILLNSDNSLIWTSNKINSYSLKHTIPATTLTNGIEYKIQITIWNQASQSITSDAEVFQTSSRPVVTIDNAGTVNSFSYNFQATYSQDESVPMSNYVAYLYNDKQQLIDKSAIKTILPMEHLFSNLQPETQYYIEFQATSQKGLVGTSGKVQFDVFYLRPKMNIDLQGRNIDNAGIELSWYVTQIIGQTDGSQFIDSEKIDTTDGTKVWFEDGFNIDKDFSLKLCIEQPYMSNIAEQVNLIKLIGENGNIYLQYHDDNKFHVWKDVNGLKSHWFSDVVQGNSYVVLIQQIQDDMNISASVV